MSQLASKGTATSLAKGRREMPLWLTALMMVARFCGKRRKGTAGLNRVYTYFTCDGVLS